MTEACRQLKIKLFYIRFQTNSIKLELDVETEGFFLNGVKLVYFRLEFKTFRLNH